MKTTKNRLMELAGLVNEVNPADVVIYGYQFESGMRFTEGDFNETTLEDVIDTMGEMSEDPDVYIYLHKSTLGTAAVLDTTDGGVLYATQPNMSTSDLTKIAKAAALSTPLFSSEDGSVQTLSTAFSTLERELSKHQ